MSNLNDLIGKNVSLFDQNGGVLNEKGEYVTNWWDLGEIVLESFRSKYILFKNVKTKSTGKVRTNKVVQVEKDEITLAI